MPHGCGVAEGCLSFAVRRPEEEGTGIRGRRELEFAGVLVWLWGGAVSLCLIPGLEAPRGLQHARGRAVIRRDRQAEARASEACRCVVGGIWN